MPVDKSYTSWSILCQLINLTQVDRSYASWQILRQLTNLSSVDESFSSSQILCQLLNFTSWKILLKLINLTSGKNLTLVDISYELKNLTQVDKSCVSWWIYELINVMPVDKSFELINILCNSDFHHKLNPPDRKVFISKEKPLFTIHKVIAIINWLSLGLWHCIFIFECVNFCWLWIRLIFYA